MDADVEEMKIEAGKAEAHFGNAEGKIGNVDVHARQEPSDAHPSVPMPAIGGGSRVLTGRLGRLEALLKETDQRLSDFTAQEADRILRRVHERIALSPDHVVTAIAGSTGSGKSSLFNALIRFELAPVGAIRPTTTTGLACIWDPEHAEAAAALLDRIGVATNNRILRGSLLDGASRTAEPELTPLVLIDLPDHDSAVRAHRDETDKATAAADLLLFVTDPQKYADASWHERYLRHLGHHQETLVVVLNKCDELAPSDARACAEDLRRILTESGLADVPVLLTSTRTGEGLQQLRELIVSRVRRKQAALLRSEADVDRAATLIAAELAPRDVHAPESLSPQAKSATLLAIGDSTSMQALSDLIDATYRRRASAVTGWPVRHAVMTLISRFRGGEAARYTPWAGAVAGEPAPPPIQHGDVEHAVADAVDRVAGAMPPPWAKEMHRIGDRCVKSLSETLDATLSGTEVGPRLVPRWWTTVQVLHWMLMTAALVGVGGAIAYAASGGGKDSSLPDTGPVPFPLLVAVVALVAGALLDLLCRPAARRAAARLRVKVAERMAERVRGAADQLLFAPLVTEHERYVRAWTLTQGLVRKT
ncbi:GTPase Era involved in 16S rRNA processing [Catenulispora sp. GAS73]|uniref:GTPase family protein n=1 Tax=Catenulispora sp. GAS73 TaxID=3156269 RepID=UPI0035198295